MQVIHFGSKGSNITQIDKINRESYGMDIIRVDEPLNTENIASSAGVEAIWLGPSSPVTAETASALRKNGVKYIVSQSSGIDHIDLTGLRENGIKASNVPAYSPNAISEFTVLFALSLLRKLKPTIRRADENNFLLQGLMGRELCLMTVGIVGTGRIGTATAKILHGFGCNILAYSRRENPELSNIVEYVSKEELFQRCDILMFHCALTEETRNMINVESITKLKDGAYLINTARGGLFDFAAVAEGLENGKIGGLAFDVYENEYELLRKNPPGVKPDDPVFCKLLKMDNVVYAPHASFYTEFSVKTMMEVSLSNLYHYLTTGNSKNELT